MLKESGGFMVVPHDSGVSTREGRFPARISTDFGPARWLCPDGLGVLICGVCVCMCVVAPSQRPLRAERATPQRGVERRRGALPAPALCREGDVGGAWSAAEAPSQRPPYATRAMLAGRGAPPTKPARRRLQSSAGGARGETAVAARPPVAAVARAARGVT